MITVSAPADEAERLLAIARSVEQEFFVSAEPWNDSLGEQVCLDVSGDWRTIDGIETAIRVRVAKETGLATFSEAEMDARYEALPA